MAAYPSASHDRGRCDLSNRYLAVESVEHSASRNSVAVVQQRLWTPFILHFAAFAGVLTVMSLDGSPPGWGMWWAFGLFMHLMVVGMRSFRASSQAPTEQRLAIVDDARRASERLAARERTLVHPIEGLCLALAREGAATPDLGDKVRLLRQEMTAEAEVDEALARSRRAATAKGYAGR
ncbi:MAG: hypothetical protein ACI9MC_004016 [Kiritimatiellia bacterium]|jgi:hypothetical protein